MPWDRRKVDPALPYTVRRPFPWRGKGLRIGDPFDVRQAGLRADQLLRRGAIGPAAVPAAVADIYESDPLEVNDDDTDI